MAILCSSQELENHTREIGRQRPKRGTRTETYKSNPHRRFRTVRRHSGPPLDPKSSQVKCRVAPALSGFDTPPLKSSSGEVSTNHAH